jgi:hypothetical protein
MDRIAWSWTLRVEPPQNTGRALLQVIAHQQVANNQLHPAAPTLAEQSGEPPCPAFLQLAEGVPPAAFEPRSCRAITSLAEIRR